MLYVGQVSLSKVTPSIDEVWENTQYDLSVGELTIPSTVKKVTAMGIRRNYDNLVDISSNDLLVPMGSFSIVDSDHNIIGEFLDNSSCDISINSLLKPISVPLNGGDTIRIIPQNSREAVQITWDIANAEHQSLDPNDKREILMDVYIQYD